MKTKNYLSVLCFVTSMVLAACGGNSTSKNSNTSEEEGPQDQQSGNFLITTDLTESQEIHTDLQKEYLAYEGDYSKMDPSNYPDGNKLLSDSLPVNLTWEYTPAEGKEVKNYEVTFGQFKDLSDGFKVTGTSEASINLQNVFLGRNYFQITANLDDDTSDTSETRYFLVDDTCPRNLAIENMTNCRDLGGRKTEDGGVIKQGMLYRTSGKKYDYSTAITQKGIDEMVNHLKVKTEINVSDNETYNVTLPGTTVKNVFMDYGGSAAHHLSRNTENVKNFFKELANIDNYPIYYHCRIGTDRTGLCTILTYGLLGVELNEIFQDYLFSNFGNIQEKRYIGERAGQDNIENYINEIQNMAGDTFKNKVYNMLLAIGVPAETLDQVIENLTDGQLAEGNVKGQVIVTADEMGATGISPTQDTSQNKNPDWYYALNSSDQTLDAYVDTEFDGKAQIVCYMGNSENSSTKKIGDAISLAIDGAPVTINDITYKDACMGTCANRTNYYPVILAEVDMSAGSHTITISGTSNKMNVANIAVFAL